MKPINKSKNNNKGTKEKINPRALQMNYLEKMEKDLSDKGVIIFEPGENLNINDWYLELPSEITEVTSKDLGEHLNAFTQQKAYLRTLMGRVTFLVEEAKRNYYSASTDVYSKLTNSKMSETAKERIVNSDPEVIPFYHEYVDYKNKMYMIDCSISNIEDIIFMISREVTRRNGDFYDDNRNHNVGRK